MFDLEKEIDNRIQNLQNKDALFPGILLHIRVNDPVAIKHGAPYAYEVRLDATNSYPVRIDVRR